MYMLTTVQAVLLAILLLGAGAIAAVAIQGAIDSRSAERRRHEDEGHGYREIGESEDHPEARW